MPEGWTVISSYVFSDNRLKSVTLPKSLKNINDEAFYNNPELLSVDIPNSKTEIGENAFGFYIDGESENKAINGFVITCFENSPAHKYALKNNFAVIIKEIDSSLSFKETKVEKPHEIDYLWVVFLLAGVMLTAVIVIIVLIKNQKKKKFLKKI